MNRQNLKDSKAFLSVSLLGLAVLMMGFTIAELINIGRGSYQTPLLTKETLEQIRPEQEKIRQYLNQYQKAAAELTRQNMFVPPPAGPEPPGNCTAIFGDEALIGDRWIKAGDQIGAAEVVAVGPVYVTLLWEDSIITRSPVLQLDEQSNPRSSRSSSRAISRDRAGNLGSGMMGGGFGGMFGGMTEGGFGGMFGGMMGGGMGGMMGGGMGGMMGGDRGGMMGEQFQERIR